MRIASGTHQGLVRLKNEDAVAYDLEQGWAALADGMGGLMAGREASEVAVLAVRRCFEQTPNAPATDALLAAHAAVKQFAEDNNYLGKTGTTLVVWTTAGFCHVGDSRIYHASDGELTCLSRDQTVAERLVDEGIISPLEALTSTKRHVLTQALGMPGQLRPESSHCPPRGRLLLCSDGLSDLVAHEVIADILFDRSLSMTDQVNALIKSALDKGGRDNISVVLIDRD